MLQGWIQIIVFFAVLTAIVPLLGGYMARVFTNERVFLSPVVGPLERLTYRVLRVDIDHSQGWKAYAGSLLVFSGVFWLALYLILRTQTLHPFNPGDFHSGTWDVTFNTASSFITNTNWQYYGGETTMTFFSQMGGLAVQNFVSAAVGIVVAVALIRGIAARRTGATGLGNFCRTSRGRCCTCCSRSRSWARCCWRLRASCSRSRTGARWPRRRSSRSSAPTAAGSST